MRNMITFTVKLDKKGFTIENLDKFSIVKLDKKGFTIENLDKFSDDELAMIMKILPYSMPHIVRKSTLLIQLAIALIFFRK